jgi:membrane protease YdiL (CAAX protease family)
VAFIHTLRRHPVPAYFVLAYALSWACWIPLAIAKTWASFPFIVFAILGNGMPSLLGVVLTALVSGKAGLAGLFGRLGRVRVPLIWYAVVLLLIPALRLAAAGIPALLGLATITVALSGVTVLGGLGAGLLEELGWRGFALPRMQARRPAFTASLLLGALWGAWHLPLTIAQGLPLTAAGLIRFVFSVLMLTAWAVLFTWVYNNTSGSLFLMVLLHAVAYTAGSAIQPGNWIGSALLLLLAWATVTLVVATAGAARLSRNNSRAPADDGDRRPATLPPAPPVMQSVMALTDAQDESRTPCTEGRKRASP